MIRPRLVSRGLTLRFRIRTVSEKGETGGRDGKGPPAEPEASGSGRGSGRRDIRWQRRISFFSLWEAAPEWSLGVGAEEEEEVEDDDMDGEGAEEVEGLAEEPVDWRRRTSGTLLGPRVSAAWARAWGGQESRNTRRSVCGKQEHIQDRKGPD